MNENRSKVRDDGYYYDFRRDFERYPELFGYIIYGGRNTGKTYSVLRKCVEDNEPFAFCKNTMADIKLLCTADSKKVRDLGIKADTSPFVSLNRDFGWNIKPFILNEYMGAFCHCDKEGMPVRGKDPVGYMLSLAAVSKYKGFDMSYIKWMILDEFVKKLWDIQRKGEGDSIMELYKTISRDREHRGDPCLKLVALANADNCSSPLTDTLEVTDQVVSMSLKQNAELYLPEREIFLHKIRTSPEFMKKEREAKIYKAMKGTRWAAMALDNDFSYNDFSQINKINLKHCQPLLSFKYKQVTYYCYTSQDGIVVLTTKQFNAKLQHFDLNLQSDIRKFFYDYVVDLQEAAMEHRIVFENFTLSQLIYDYKKLFYFT